MVDHLDSILRITQDELGSVEKNGKYHSREDIDSVYKLIDIVKDIYCIWNYENEEDDGNSYMDDRRDMRGYSRYDGNSYARGRGRNARRDSMGRYSRNSYRGYSRDDGKEEYIENLRNMMENAPDEQTRMEIQRMIQKMEQN